jgi:D-inositol-3-phosphate glycosyltransferase
MKNQLRIAIICIHSCPLGMLGGRDTGGMNVYIVELARELEKRGCAIDIFTRAHYPEHTMKINIGENIRLIHIDSGTCEEMPNVAFYSYLQKFICGIEGYRSSNNIRYDVIHSHYWLSGAVGRELQALWHIPHMTMFHTLGIVKNNTGIGEEETELRIEKERELVQTCDRIIAATEREQKELVRYYHAPQEKIAIIPCGINPDLFTPVDRYRARQSLGLTHKKIVLFVGRIDPLKGLDRLIHAVANLNGDISPALVIVGGDGYSRGEVNSLKSLAAELHVEDRIIFQGSVDQDRLPLFYSAADICAVPSYYESFGLVALESLACGTAVVATDVGDMKNIIASPVSGTVVHDNGVAGLSYALSALLSEKDNGNEKETRRSGIMKYSWSNIADRTIQEYESILITSSSAPIEATFHTTP